MSNIFSVSENEYNRIDSVRGQLNLICGLLCARDANCNNFTASDLYDFVSAQADTLSDVIKALDVRYETSKEEGQLNHRHWEYALKIASGDKLHTPNGAEESVLEGLIKAARIDADFSRVTDLWIEILGKQKSAQEVNAIAQKPTPRKRDKLVGKSMEVAS